MLWYKAWLESRSRFLTSIAMLTFVSAFFVHHAQEMIRPEWKTEFNRLMYIDQQFIVIMWILAVTLLGMGGIIREKAIGTSSLTLALPVSRARLLVVRVGMGVGESIVLAVVPWVTVFAVSSLARMPILITQVAFYCLLLIGGGLVYFAFAVLVSSLVAGEYTAPAVAFGVVLLSAVVFDAWFQRFNVWRLVTGDFSLDRNSYLLLEPIPWLGILACLSAAALMLLGSIIVVQRKEF
jgi:ABC-2 type transport system permease protein